MPAPTSGTSSTSRCIASPASRTPTPSSPSRRSRRDGTRRQRRSMTQPRDVIFASKLFQDWLEALKQRALLQTHNQSYAMFRAVLHALRRHMTTAQVLNFADALPPLPRGIFIEDWRPAEPLPVKSAKDFIRDVIKDLAPHHVPPDSIVKDV